MRHHPGLGEKSDHGGKFVILYSGRVSYASAAERSRSARVLAVVGPLSHRFAELIFR
jgi:hypothetical protein